MQGPRSSITTLPENLNFDRGSSSGDNGIEPQLTWNTMQTSAQNGFPDLARSDLPIAEWSLGESSSSLSHHQGDQDETKKEHAWPLHPQGQYGQSTILSLDSDGENPDGNQTANGPFNALPQDLNMISEFDDQEEDDDDDCQIIEGPTLYGLIGPSNDPRRSVGSSSDSLVIDEGEDGQGCTLGVRRMSCKRKTLEEHIGQSSGSTSMQMPTENEIVVNDSSESAIPRLRLGVGGSVSASPFPLSPSGSPESSRRNFRLRMYQQEPIIPENLFSADVGNMDSSSSSQFSLRLIRNHLFDLNPSPPVENGPLHGPSLPTIPSVRRHHHSRWNRASSTRSSRSSSSSEDRNIPDHPMLVPASEIGSSSQNPTNWSLPGGSTGNGGPISRAGPSTGPNSSGPSWANRNQAQHPRRLSEIVRRSLLSSAGVESRGESSNQGVRLSSSALSQEIVPPSGSESHGPRLISSRSALLDRHLEGGFGISHPLRSLAAAGEGRSSIMSEIRHVLDLMRRGEGLRVEDVMILDHSVLFGMADIHDRHRDMRLDVDNMSYEELLALEERIGNVCTGLSEEIITSRLKLKKFVDIGAVDSVETEPCSICREEYNAGEDLGILECGHDFHTDCIKQWLMQKNLCPICKTTGLTT